jgi:hypothetical protein
VNIVKTLNSSRFFACALAALPVAAQAQDFSGAVTLGYGLGSISNGGGDIDSLTLDGSGAIQFQNGWVMGLDATLAKMNPEGPGDFDTTDLGVNFAYQMASGATIGAYGDFMNFDTTGPVLGNTDTEVTSYGLNGGYVNDSFGAEFHLGISEVDGGGDWTDYGVTLRFRPTDATRIGGHWMMSEGDVAGGGSFEITSIGIGADHSFGRGFSAFGGVNFVDADQINTDVTTYGVGIGYDLSAVTSAPINLSLELARSDLDAGAGSVEEDTVRFGVTFALGNAKRAPENSVARSVMTPRHNALSTLIDTAY